MSKILVISAILLAFSLLMPANIVQARGRYGSHRVGGNPSSGKGSHYVGGYVRNCHGNACR